MSTFLTEFHFHLSQLPVHFDFENEKFDIKDIYNHYQYKVTITPIFCLTKSSIAPKDWSISVDGPVVRQVSLRLRPEQERLRATLRQVQGRRQPRSNCLRPPKEMRQGH